MSLKDIRSECEEWAGLLQPYVDGELDLDEQERVAAHLESCGPCRSAVGEQVWVRRTLAELERDRAPQALRAKVMLSLDAVDAEREKEHAPPPKPSMWAWMRERARAMGRGGLIMVPAGALAVALFVVAKQGATPSDVRGLGPRGLATALPGASVTGTQDAAAPEEPTQTETDDVLQALRDVEPRVGFPIQVARPQASQQVELVSARLDRVGAGSAAGAHLRYRVFRNGAASEHHVVDEQLPARTGLPTGTPVTYRGQEYLVGRTEAGEPVVYFERRGVVHNLRLEGVQIDDPGAEGPSEADYTILFDFAARNLSRPATP